MFDENIDRSNADIVRYQRIKFIMNWEIAEIMGINVDQYRELLSTPLTRQEKSDIAEIINQLVRDHDAKLRAVEDSEWHLFTAEERNRKYSEWLSAHNCLNDGRKYTGNGSYDRYEGCWHTYD